MNQAIYLFDPRHRPAKPPQTPWGKPSPGKCVVYAHRRADGLWYVADLRVGRETPFDTRTDAVQYVAGLAAADPTLTIGGAQ